MKDINADGSPKIETYSAPSIQKGSEEISYGGSKELYKLIDSENICEELEEDKLKKIAQELTDLVDEDRETMTDYLKKYEQAIKLSKLDPEHRAKNFPFDNASNLVMPYVMAAALDFQSRAMPALLERRNICKIDINGLDPDGSKEARGERVAAAINQDLRHGIKGWRDQQDAALLLLPLVGTYFKKTWQCPYENKRKSQLVYPDELIFNHKISSFDQVTRKAFEYRMSKNDVLSCIRAKEFVNIDIDDYKDDEDIEFIEIHCWLDLDEDDYKEPYIVNIEKNNKQQIVSIVARFDDEDISVNEKGEVVRIKAEEFFTQAIFIPDPLGSCMGIGWGILLGDMFAAINTNMNQLIDAGTLYNTSANSFLYRAGMRGGNRARKGPVKVNLGQGTAIESGGTNPLAQDIVQLPFSGPSTVLFQLLESMKAEVKELTMAGQGIDPMPNEAAEMYLARMQQAMAGSNSIMIRVFSGVSKEIKRIYEIMQRYLGQEAYLEMTGDQNANWAIDFADDLEISTTADPSQGSEMERMARAKAVYEEAKQNPAIEIRKAANDYFEAMGVKDVAALLPEPKQGEPDPLQVMQAQAMQTMSEAERLKAEADIMVAQAKMVDAQISMAKLDSEIQKMEAETFKLLSEIEKNTQAARINELKEARSFFNDQMKTTMELVRDHRRKAEDARNRV